MPKCIYKGFIHIHRASNSKIDLKSLKRDHTGFCDAMYRCPPPKKKKKKKKKKMQPKFNALYSKCIQLIEKIHVPVF